MTWNVPQCGFKNKELGFIPSVVYERYLKIDHSLKKTNSKNFPLQLHSAKIVSTLFPPFKLNSRPDG